LRRLSRSNEAATINVKWIGLMKVIKLHQHELQQGGYNKNDVVNGMDSICIIGGERKGEKWENEMRLQVELQR
jgi:hypothetical protein